MERMEEIPQWKQRYLLCMTGSLVEMRKVSKAHSYKTTLRYIAQRECYGSVVRRVWLSV
jgi:hypothetical protein